MELQEKLSFLKDDHPPISVTMGCFNFEQFIAEAIESLLNQTLQPAKIIIGDDFSTDRSWEIIQSYAAKYPDIIEAYRHPERKGHIHNGIFMKDKIKTVLFSEIDGDDRWHPDKLKKEYEALRTHPECDIAYSGVRIIDEAGGAKESWIYEAGHPPTGNVFVSVFSKRYYTNTRSLFRNPLMYFSCMKAVGYGVPEESIVHTDWDRKIRLTARHMVVGVDELLVDYRSHSGGISSLRMTGLYESAKVIFNKNKHLIRELCTPEEQAFIIENINSLFLRLVLRTGNIPATITVAHPQSLNLVTIPMPESVLAAVQA